MSSTGKLSSSLNHLINTYNSQLQNKEINNNNIKTAIQQPFISCTAPALDNNLTNSVSEISTKVANITLSTTDTNNNTTKQIITPLVTVGNQSLSSSTRRKSSTSSYTNSYTNLNAAITTTTANTTPTVVRPTNLRSTESSPEQNANQSISGNNLLSVSTSGMKSRRHSDNAINVPKIEIAPR